MTDKDSKPAFPFSVDITFQPGDIVFATDKRGRLVYWNTESEQLFGYGADEVIGNPFDVICLVSPGGPEIDLPAILSGRDFAGGVRCFDKSGREIDLYVYATAGRNRSGTATGVVFVARDVSEFWHAEQAVRTAEDKYRLLFENYQDSVAITDIEGRVLEVNPACLQLYGYTADEARQLNLADVVAPENRADAAEAMADLAVGNPVTKTLQMLRKDGTRFVADLVASIVSVNGEQRTLSVTRDVTERVRAEQATSDAARKYRAVFESANDAVLVETVDGRILDANENACVLLGYTREELLALKVSDLVPVEARAWLPRVTDAILQDRTFRTEAVNVHKSGRHIPVEISASTMEMDDGTLVLAIVRDISERKRVEAALAESENRYRTLFNDSLMGIYRTSPDGQIQLANPALVRMLGYESFAQLAERNLETDGSGPEYRRDEFKRRLERDGRIVGLEVRWQTRDGRTLFVRESARAVRGQDGAVLHYEGTVEDITERKLAVEALRESEEKFRSLSEQSPNMIFINSGGRVVYANRKCVDEMGYSREEFRASEFDFMRLIAPESVDTIKAVYARHRRGEEVEPYEYTLVTKDGRRIESIITTRLIDYEGSKAILGIVTDITERKQAEQALRESEERFRRLVDASPDGIAVYQNELVVIANQSCARMLGYDSPDALAGRKAGEFVNPDDLAIVVESEKMLQGRPAGPAEGPLRVRFRHRDGTWVHAEVVAAGTTWKGTRAIQVMVRDITERRRAEATLAASEARYRTLFDSIRDGVYLLDRDGRFTSVNDAIVSRSGRPREWWLGRNHAGTVRPEDRVRVRQAFEAAMRGESVEPYEAAYPTASGELLFIEMNVAPIREGDKVVGMVGISRDTTGRKSAEKRLQESEERFRRLVELSPDGIAVHQDGKLVLVNPAGVRVLGYERPEELVGTPVFDLVHPDDQPGVLARIKQVMQLGKPGELVEERFRRKDGSYVPVEVVNAPFFWNGKPAVQVVVRDISGRKELAWAAEAAEAQMQAVLDNSPDGIAAECEGVVAYANRRFAELYGYDSPAQVTGRPVTDFLAPEDHDRVAEYSKARTRGEPAPTRYRFKGIRRDSRLVEVEITVSTYSLLGKQYLLGFLREAAARPRAGKL